jgi:DNA-binding transcriptional ArsR family regulator
VGVLHERDATVEELGSVLGLDAGAVASHVRLLYRGGVVCRTDPGGRGRRGTGWRIGRGGG